MLDAHQCEVIAYSTDSGVACESCALDFLEPDDRAKVGEALSTSSALADKLNVEPLIRYEVGQYQDSLAEDEHYGGELPENQYPAVTCCECDAEILEGGEY